jgi:hypothetical protein
MIQYPVRSYNQELVLVAGELTEFIQYAKN